MERTDSESGPSRDAGKRLEIADPYAAAGEPVGLHSAREQSSATVRSTGAKISAAREACPSGLVLYQGRTVDPLAVAEHVSHTAPWHLILTRTALSQPHSIELENPDYLWNWYPLDVQQQVSPVLLSPTGAVDVKQIVKQAWGQDAIVWVFADCAKADLLKQLTAAIRGDDGSSTAPPDRVLGFNLPSAARPMLHQLGLAAFPPLESSVGGFLMEAEQPGGWQLYCAQKLDLALQAIIELV